MSGCGELLGLLPAEKAGLAVTRRRWLSRSLGKSQSEVMTLPHALPQPPGAGKRWGYEAILGAFQLRRGAAAKEGGLMPGSRRPWSHGALPRRKETGCHVLAVIFVPGEGGKSFSGCRVQLPASGACSARPHREASRSCPPPRRGRALLQPSTLKAPAACWSHRSPAGTGDPSRPHRPLRSPPGTRHLRTQTQPGVNPPRQLPASNPTSAPPTQNPAGRGHGGASRHHVSLSPSSSNGIWGFPLG